MEHLGIFSGEIYSTKAIDTSIPECVISFPVNSIKAKYNAEFLRENRKKYCSVCVGCEKAKEYYGYGD